MKKLLKALGIVVAGLAVLLVGFVVAASMQPDTYEYARSTVIQAPIETVFNEVNNLESFTSWSPWSGRDPNMKVNFTGPKLGMGAKYTWSGNEEVGKGEMEIVESRPSTYVEQKLRFIEPWEDEAKTAFQLEETAGGTRITWSMSGENNFAAKAFGLFFDMEEMINKDYDQGLASLKKKIESAPK